MSIFRNGFYWKLGIGIFVLIIAVDVGLYIRILHLEKKIAASPLERSIQTSHLKEGIQAPRFTLKDLEGRDTSLDDFKGQRLLLVFTNPNCKACVGLYPLLNMIHSIRKDLIVIMISRATGSDNRALAAKEGIHFLLLSGERAVFDEYQVCMVPFCYLIDPDSRIVVGGLASSLEHIEGIIGPTR